MSNDSTQDFEDTKNDDGKLGVLIHGIVGWFNLIMPFIFIAVNPASGGGFSFFHSAAAIFNAILFPIIWGVMGILWLLTLFIDSAFLSWLFQFWIVISWAGVFGGNWLGCLITLLGVLFGADENGLFAYFIIYLLWGGGSTFVTVFFGKDTRDEIKTWYDADDAPNSDFVDNVEGLGDDAEDATEDWKDENTNEDEWLIRF
jgi:hypothetical protein